MSRSRRNIMLGTAGHVDHGKTALVKALTGCNTDTLAEEQQRGLTIDLGFAPCQLADERIVGVVDVPGHVDFIRNMVAGAHGIDVVIFVVAADDGIMPQTHEHLHVLTLMGVRHGLVALTKIDLVEAGRRAQVADELRRLLGGTFLADAPICPLSNVTGEGFEGFFDALNRVVDTCGDRSCSGVFRVWVEDVFTIRGTGTVITGIPVSGRVRLDDRLHLLPAGLAGHLRRMQVYGEDAAEARAGECVAMNLPELDHEVIRRGQVLCESALLAPVTMAEGELRLLDSVKGRIEDYLEVHLHVGTASVLARVAMLEATEMLASQRQMVQLRLAEPLALAPGDRFVVRANAPGAGLTTLGGGRLLGVSNVRLRRKKPWTLAMLGARREVIDDPVRWCEQILREASRPATAAALQQECRMRPEELTGALEKLRAEGRVLDAPGGTFIHRESVATAATRVIEAMRAFHTTDPNRAGISREELMSGSPSAPSPAIRCDPQVLDLAIESLLTSRQIERNGVVYAQVGWSARVTDRDQQLCERITATLQEARWAPPSLEELAGALHEAPPRVEKMLRLLVERGLLVRLDERILMHPTAIDAAKQVALGLFRKAPSFTTMDFRDALGVSRKYAVPLVDHLDRARFTVRSGNNRTPGVEAKKLLAAAQS